MLIDRIAVKQRAKDIIKESRPSMLYAGLIYTLLGALIGFLSLRLTGIDYDTMTKVMQATAAGKTDMAMSILSKSVPGAGESIIDLLLQLAMAIVGVGFVLFTLNTIRRTGPDLANMLDGFGMMPRVLFLIILEYVFIALWSLLLVVPGIVAAYRYSLAVYIMIDHPEKSAMECIRESKRMTKGYKGQLFMLDLSFLLWLFFSALPVVGYAVQVYLTPYQETAKALYYEKIRTQQNEWETI